MVNSSVKKALSLIEYLGSQSRPCTLTEISEACKISKPSTVRLLFTLQDLGYVARPVASRKYMLGPMFHRFATSDPFADLKRVARPILKKLHEEFNETSNLGVLSEQSVLYLDYIETTRPLRLMVSPGSHDIWFFTALGRAIAAAIKKKNSLDRLLKRTDYSHKSASGRKYTIKDIQKILTQTRTRGYAEEADDAAEGVGCIACSLQHLGYPGAAISLAIPTQRLTGTRKKQIITALLNATNNQKK